MFKDRLVVWLLGRRCWSANLLFNTEIKTFKVLQRIRLPVLGEALTLHLQPTAQNVHAFSEISQQLLKRKMIIQTFVVPKGCTLRTVLGLGLAYLIFAVISPNLILSLKNKIYIHKI